MRGEEAFSYEKVHDKVPPSHIATSSIVHFTAPNSRPFSFTGHGVDRRVSVSEWAMMERVQRPRGDLHLGCCQESSLVGEITPRSLTEPKFSVIWGCLGIRQSHFSQDRGFRPG